MIDLQKSGKPMYIEIYEQLRDDIFSGRLKAGEKLSSRRHLASELNISVTTVSLAYDQLLSEGFIEVRPRSGFYVTNTEGLVRDTEPSPSVKAQPLSGETALIHFSTSGVDPDSFPYSVWKKCQKAAMETRPANHRTHPQGEAPLREAIARYLYEARSISCLPEQIVIGSGSDNIAQFLSLLFSGDYAFICENPVYNRAYSIFELTSHPLFAVPMDKKGISAAHLPKEEKCVCYVTPSHQFPMGISMPLSRRIQLLSWAEQGSDRYIIEDDYDSEFRYAGRPLPSLSSIDTAQRVIYLGTFSKSISPALRIGFVVLPPALLELYRAKLQNVLSCPVSLEQQLTLARFLSEGHFVRHLNRMRLIYKKKRALLLESLSALGPRTEILGENAGHHLLLHMKTQVPAERLIQLALDKGVRLTALSSYFIGKPPAGDSRLLVLGYGALSEEEIRRGVQLLKEAWASVL